MSGVLHTPKRIGYLEAAQRTGLVNAGADPTSTIRSLVKRGLIPHIRVSERIVVFDVDELDAWLESKRVAALTAEQIKAASDERKAKRAANPTTTRATKKRRRNSAPTGGE